MKPYRNINGQWEIHDYSDADYAGYNSTWKSATGYIVLIDGAVIDWRLQYQKKLHYILQKLDIQQSQRYGTKY